MSRVHRYPPYELTEAQAAEVEAAESHPCPFCDGRYAPLSFGLAHSTVDGEVQCERYLLTDEDSDDFLRACRAVNLST